MPRSKEPVSQKQLAAAGFAVLRLEGLPAVTHLNAQELFALERIARAQNRDYALAEDFHRMGRGIRTPESPAQ